MNARSPVIRVFDCHVARRFEAGHQFLLLRRAPGKIYADSWRMVGGKLKENETAWQGCLRELAEETRLVAKRLLVVPYVNRFYEWEHDRLNDIPVFVALVPEASTPLLDDEHVDYAWLSPSAAAARLPWPGQRAGLEAAANLLLDRGPLPHYLEVALEPGASA